MVEQAFTGILLTMNVKANGPAAVYSHHFGEAHELVLSLFLLQETARVLRYPRLKSSIR